MVATHKGLALALFVAAAGFPILSLASAQDVLVVDPSSGPGTDFTSLVDAVNAAQDGDTILVREGVYNEIFLILGGRSLSLVADSGARVQVPEIVITGVGADQTVLVRGLISSQSGPFLPAIEVRNCAGSVWIEDCDTTPGNGFGGGVTISNSANVVLSRIHSGVPTANPFGLESLAVVDSTVRVFDSRIAGLPDTPGVRASGSDLYLQGSDVRGGSGCAPGILVQAGAHVALLENHVQAGPGANCDGEPIRLEGGTVQQLDGDATALRLASPVTEGSRVQLTFRGSPGASAWLVLSDRSTANAVLPFGVFVLGAPRNVISLGAVPEIGKLERSFALPPTVPPGDTFGQVLTLGDSTALSAPSVLTVKPRRL